MVTSNDWFSTEQILRIRFNITDSIQYYRIHSILPIPLNITDSIQYYRFHSILPIPFNITHLIQYYGFDSILRIWYCRYRIISIQDICKLIFFLKIFLKVHFFTKKIYTRLFAHMNVFLCLHDYAILPILQRNFLPIKHRLQAVPPGTNLSSRKIATKKP